MSISRSVRNSQDPSVPEAPAMKSPRRPGVFLPVLTGGKQVEGFSWLKADRFAHKGACATSFLEVSGVSEAFLTKKTVMGVTNLETSAILVFLFRMEKGVFPPSPPLLSLSH